MSNNSSKNLLQKKNAELAKLERQLVIEAALEEVRSTAMAMHQSEDLINVATVMVKAFQDLGMDQALNAGFALIDEEKQVQYMWGSQTNTGMLEFFTMSLFGDAVLERRYDAWKRREPVFSSILGAEDLKRHLEVALPTEQSTPAENESKGAMPDPTYFYFGNFKQGYLQIIAGEALSEEHQYILIRFAGVFEQAYTRFLDIKKAEDQALRLQELDRAKTIFYTNITHEFRTPLTVIIGMVENIKGHETEKKLIRRNSNNLLRLINELLTLSKLDAGEMELHNTHANIISYLKYLTESFHSMAKELQIDLHFQSELEELFMDFDENKIQHIVYNLLSNALKFSSAEDQVVLQVTKEEHDNAQYLQLRVSDTGIGIEEKDLVHLFDRFYQADATSTRKGEGTGIGLALTKELVELMDGEISVKSKFGEGTDFTILLPIKKESNLSKLEQVAFPKSQTPVATSIELPLQENTSSEKPQLLIIEDNQDITIYISTLLGSDYQIFTAQNGQEGIDKAIEIVPDIIISDVMMPEKNGYEVCEILKQDERSSHIPIILLTAKATQEAKVEGLKYGADAYLTKPFHREELLVRLEQLVALRKQLQAKYTAQQTTETSKKELLPPIENAFLQKLNAAITSHLDDTDFSVTQLAQIMLLSQVQLYRKVKALTGKNTMLYIRSLRLKKAKELLLNSDLNISEIAYEVGFSDPSYFSRVFQQEFNHPPTFFRK